MPRPTGKFADDRERLPSLPGKSHRRPQPIPKQETGVVAGFAGADQNAPPGRADHVRSIVV
jgi:hypothetical protein